MTSTPEGKNFVKAMKNMSQDEINERSFIENLIAKIGLVSFIGGIIVMFIPNYSPIGIGFTLLGVSQFIFLISYRDMVRYQIRDQRGDYYLFMVGITFCIFSVVILMNQLLNIELNGILGNIIILAWSLITLIIVPWAILKNIEIPQLSLANHSKSWPSTEGQIIKSEYTKVVDRTSDGYSTKFPIDFKYEVNIGGKLLEKNTVYIYESEKPKEKLFKISAWRFVKKFPEGKRVKVYFNPDKNYQTILKPGIKRFHILRAGFPIMFLMLGVGLLLYTLISL